VLGTIVLFFVILVQRESRHKNRALEDAEYYAEIIQKRVGSRGLLPINLDRDLTDPQFLRGFSFENIPRSDSRCFRNYDGPVIVAYTQEISLPFRSDGRAIVLFERGEFRVEWFAVSEFNRRFDEQRATMTRLEKEKRRNGPVLP